MFEPCGLVRDLVRRHGQDQFGRPVLVEKVGDVELGDILVFDLEIAAEHTHRRILFRQHSKQATAHHPRPLPRLRLLGKRQGRNGYGERATQRGCGQHTIRHE
jgi:hypothetical protein